MESVEIRPVTELDIEPLARYLTHKPSAQSMRDRFQEVELGHREMLVALIDGSGAKLAGTDHSSVVELICTEKHSNAQP